ncbi:MAG: redoxin domain-containing protein [Candidatus Ryanbacteria bacterium]|nr:redoxin domain-containing protein [Candidatus Ryanbacteria bacterium]
MDNTWRTSILVVVLVLIGGSIYYFESQKVKPNRELAETTEADIAPRVEDVNTPPPEPGEGKPVPTPTAIKKSEMYALAKEIVSPSGFVNTKPLKIQDLVGKKVILVDFWTYSCINCQRTQPYLNAWYDKYHDQGLEIVGVHTPEFGFEKILANVEQATRDAQIKYPVVLDNDYATWNAYKNRFWPRKYLIDIDGYIVYDHIGEGGYDETEQKIQQALRERMSVLKERGSIADGMVKPDAETPSFGKPLSRETYFGAWRNTNFGNGTPRTELEKIFTLPDSKNIEREKFYLDGAWQVTQEYAKTTQRDARLVFRFSAKDVHMVAGAPNGATVRILQDGKPVSGGDVKDGKLQIRDAKRYHLIENSSFGEHLLEIYIEDAGLEAFTFTFG